MYPPITIVMTTYFPPDSDREDAALRTLDSWQRSLRYIAPLHYHLADDGSISDFTKLAQVIKDPRSTVSFSQQVRGGVGASLNRGFAKAFETSPLVLYAVDDWALTQVFDLTPWAQLLLERADVGVVRLGPPHPGIMGQVEALTENWQGWGLRLARQAFAFGHRPALYHQRMIEYYGWFGEGLTALKCEEDYNQRFCAKIGPDVVLALPHPWQHLASVELSGVDPLERR